MKKLTYLVLLVFVFACNDSDDIELKKNEFGTQVLVDDIDTVALNFGYYVFSSITAKDTPYDFNTDGTASFDILAQFPECARDDAYEFQSELFRTKFIGDQCEPEINPLDGLDTYIIGVQDEIKSSFRLLIYNSEEVSQRISIDNFELFENEEGKRTFTGEWTSFDPDFVFDVVMTEIDTPE